MSRRGTWVALTVLLLLAAMLRCWNLGGVPPGLSHDEIANGLIARQILDGQHAIYFTRAYGHEPFYQYVQAATVALFGEHWLGLRWPSFAFGLLGVAAVYALSRRLFNRSVALLTIAGLTIAFWPLFYARVGLRAITLPFTGALAAYFLARTLEEGSDAAILRIPDQVLGGIFLGLSLYTYMAARALPFIFAAIVLYRFLIPRETRFPWSRILVLFLIGGLIAGPLIVWLALHPGAEYRVAEVRRPLDELLANLNFFGLAGDPWPHQGIPGRPVFAEPVGALLFYLGLVVAIWRWRTPQYGFLLVWLLGALVPSILSAHAPPGLISDAPSSVRNVLALVVVFVYPAVTLTEAWRWLSKRLADREMVISEMRRLVLVAALLLPALLLTMRDYYGLWPRREDVQYFYQTDLTAVGRYLDVLSPETAVTVAGLSVDSMDRPTLAFSAERDVQDVRLCDARETLVIPGGGEGRVLVPQVVPLEDGQPLHDRLTAWSAMEVMDHFTVYALEDRKRLSRHVERLASDASLSDGTPMALPASFSGQLALVGYEQLPRGKDGSIGLLTYWRVEERPNVPLKAFLHLTRDGQLIAQDDGLASLPEGWAAGDLIIQQHVVRVPAGTPDGLCDLELGLYNPASQERLSVEGGDRVLLKPVVLP